MGFECAGGENEMLGDDGKFVEDEVVLGWEVGDEERRGRVCEGVVGFG